MTDYLLEHHLLGLAIGFVTFIVIGLFHPLVIKGYYFFGLRVRWAFLILGILTAIGALTVGDLFMQVILGVTTFTSFWSILEVKQQRARVKKGWFPANPRRPDQLPDTD